MINKDQLAMNAIRILSAEAIEKAKSGHPGLPMGTAAIAYTLWAKEMRHNPANPNWVNRDRFVISAGHGSMLLYSLLYLFGYGLTLEDLKQFRQLDSKTPGHPEFGHTIGIETTTGPLGQGVANGVGMAMAEAHLAANFNKEDGQIVDHYTYVLAGDGCMMEGITSEAASLAGTLKLNKLVVLYDSNNISIEGNTDIAFRENVGERYKAYGWNVIFVDDGNDADKISKAIKEAKEEKERPTLIEFKTQIGYGCPGKQGKASAHGEPLGAAHLQETKACLGWNTEEPFYVPEELTAYMAQVQADLAKYETAWNETFNAYADKYEEDAKQWAIWNSKELPVNLMEDEAYWTFDKEMATRESSGEVIQRLAAKIPNLFGGSADLAPSNKTLMKGKGDFTTEDKKGSNLHFGVREHAMAAIINGIALHGGLHTYGATFFVFIDYMKGAMRLSALMGLPVTYVLTHDSIGVGEDGPTHQPIEHLASLRSTPNFTVFRPADSKETAAAWLHAISNTEGPTAIVLTRQKLPLYKETGKDALKGAYILSDCEGTPDVILMATGSEVEWIYKAGQALAAKGTKVRVVSMPSWELFEKQSAEYKESVLPKVVRKRVAVEAASDFGWHKYVGLDGAIISMKGFGISGPASTLFKKYGFTEENVIAEVEKLLQ